MIRTIDLDHKLCFEANEVSDIGADRLLPAKLQAVFAPTLQPLPQEGLRFGWNATQFPGMLNQLVRLGHEQLEFTGVTPTAFLHGERDDSELTTGPTELMIK